MNLTFSICCFIAVSFLPISIAHPNPTIISPEFVFQLAECTVKNLYERKAPSTVNMPRRELVKPIEEEEMKKYEQNQEEQFQYFMEPNFEFGKMITICIGKTSDRKELEKMKNLILKSGYPSWVKREKEQLKKEYKRIGTEGYVYANRGDRNFGNREIRKLQLRYWRRLPIPHGIVDNIVYSQIVLDLIGKLQLPNNHHQFSTISWLKNLLGEEIQNNKLRLAYTYHNYFMEHRLNSDWDDKNKRIYFNSVYQIFEEFLKEELKNVQVPMAALFPNAIKVQIPKVKHVIWTVRSYRKRDYWSAEEYEKLAFGLQKAFENIHIKQMYVTQDPNEKFANRYSEILETANIILGNSGKHKDVKVYKLTGNPDLKQSYQRGGRSESDGDDADLYNVEEMLTRMLAGENDGLVIEGNHAKAGTSQEDVVMAEVKKFQKDTKDDVDENLSLELAPGEENAVHIVLVHDVDESLAIQQVFTGTYKYPAQGSITKLVQLELPHDDGGQHSGSSTVKFVHAHGNEPEIIEHNVEKLGTKGDILRKSIRLIFAGETKHLGKMRENEEFMEKYWTK